MARSTPEQAVEASTAGLVGKACCLCGTALASTDVAVVCPRCSAIHHAECWRRNGGCGRVGCPQVAITIKPDVPTSPPPVKPPSGWWPRAGQKVALALALLALLVYVGTSVHRNRLESATVQVRLAALVPADLLEEDRYQRLAQQFEATHPGVRVTVSLAPYRGYEQKLLITTGAGDPPDVFMLSPARAPFYAQHGALLRLDTFWLQLPAAQQSRWQSLRWNLDSHLYGLARAPGWPAVWVISSQTDHPALAWELLVYFLQATSQDGKPPRGFTLDPQLMPDLWGVPGA